MQTKIFSNLFRKLYLLYLIDYLRYYYFRLAKQKSNRKFLTENPGIMLPPDYLMYESFQLDYRKYYQDSADTANWLMGLFEKHTTLKNKSILDWGCGPGRIIRHLPGILQPGCSYYGTDVNSESIQWCQKNLPAIQFSVNMLHPPLTYKEETFDLIYGISIFTHLSKSMHSSWIKELFRVLRPGGILLITTQGKSFRKKLLHSESESFNKGKLVVRGQVREGHRTFSAFQPEKYMRSLLKEFEVLEFIEREESPRPQQDIWIVRKK
ncbi:MAG: class I SAM-dependent methyltransferase [Bacteroidetes bacterium]|nr:class I SAM-dependent methyltransferase [Bacteroidota bacterium]